MNVELVDNERGGRNARVTVEKNVVVPVLHNFLVGIGIVIIGIGLTDVMSGWFRPDMYIYIKAGTVATGIFASMRAAWDEFTGIVFYFGEGFGKMWIHLERELYKAKLQKLQEEIYELRADNIVIKKQGVVSNDELIGDIKALLVLHSKDIPMTRESALKQGIKRGRWERIMHQFEMAGINVQRGQLMELSEKEAYNRIIRYIEGDPKYNGLSNR